MAPAWRYLRDHPNRLPLINPNEPEALLASLYISDGQQLAEGDLLCTLETTKSTADVHAEAAGFVAGLRVSEGQTVNAGELLCYLADTPDWRPPDTDLESQRTRQLSKIKEDEAPPGMRITQPALKLAQAHALDLSQFQTDSMITESMVRSVIEKFDQSSSSFPQSDFDPMAMIIYGGGGHGKACLEYGAVPRNVSRGWLCG